jgi:hypothetical protein
MIREDIFTLILELRISYPNTDFFIVAHGNYTATLIINRVHSIHGDLRSISEYLKNYTEEIV